MEKEDVQRKTEGKQIRKGKEFRMPGSGFGKENFLILALAGVLLLVIAWPVDHKKNVTQSSQLDSERATMDLQTDFKGSIPAEQENDFISYAEYLEQSLQKLLSTMEGVGKVRVMVTLEGTGETIVEKDLNTRKNGSTEVDSTGGSRNISDFTEEENTVFYDTAGGDAPIVRQMRAPKVAGVAVSAQGGGNAVTEGNIKKAIQALFGIDAHKIIIVKMISQ